MTTDSSGYVYIGTNDGFYRFDGYKFEKYPVTGPDSLSCPIHNIRCLHYDGNNIWIGGVEGLAKLNIATGKFKYFKPDTKEVEAGIRPVVQRIQQIDNKLFLGTYRSISIVDIASEKITKVPLSDNIKSLYTYGICKDKNGKIWIGTAQDGLLIYKTDGGGLSPVREYFKDYIPLPQQSIISVIAADEETIWAGTKSGLFAINTSTGIWKEIELHNDKGAHISPEVRKIIKDENNNFYIATLGDGLFYYDSGKGSFINYHYTAQWNNSLPDNSMNDIAEGANGVFWIAGEDGGLSKINTWFNRYEYTVIPTLSTEKTVVTVTDVELKGNDTWLATSEGLIKYTADKKFVLYNPEKQGYPSRYLQFLETLTDEYFAFLAYDDGVCVFNTRTLRFEHLQPPGKTIGGKDVVFDWLSYVDKSGNYYMSTAKGDFFRCNYIAKTIDTLFTSEKIKLDYPVVIPEPDNNNNLWIIASSSLYHYNIHEQKLKHIDHDKNGNDLPPVGFQEDVIAVGKSKLYIASDEGFFIYDLIANTLIRFTEKEGLPDNNCFSLFTDNDNRHFILQPKSIVLYNEKDNSFTTCPTPELKAVTGTQYFDADGNLYTGVENAFIKINKGALSTYIAKPQLSIVQIQNGDHIISRTDINTQKKLSINYNEFPLLISYELIDHLNPGNNKVRYKLEGWDKDWITDDKQNFKALYSHLDPGTYTFRIEGTNGFNKNVAALTIPIEIIPPFWQTWWFITATIIILLAGIYALYKYRLNQLLKLQAVRNKIASDLHDDVGSTLSSIRMYSDIVSTQVKESNPQSTVLLDKISSNSKEMIENMSDIVWMIKPGNDAFKNIENRMLNFANELCTPAAINFEFNKDAATDAIQISMEQRRDIYLIFKEAVNNAVKYSGCHNLRVAISLQNHQLQMHISDDGKGFDSSTSKNGNGLSNMQKRAATHKGILNINSASGEGTEIIVSFPL
ncbi:MAG TPA: two-component regulator propeller domain-containing protein [Panacibacter sp.]|nr:two-component regulator propeller domain-containing protein [Panacibacter sp.]